MREFGAICHTDQHDCEVVLLVAGSFDGHGYPVSLVLQGMSKVRGIALPRRLGFMG